MTRMSRGSKLRWLWRAPARALGRARDFYVRSVTGCSRYFPADAAFGYPVFVPASLARSQSYGSDWSGGSGAEDDIRELIRAASQRRAEQQQMQAQAVARSQSMVGISMARIDEDAPCEFGAGAVFPRSQSCVGGSAGRRSHCHGKAAALG